MPATDHASGPTASRSQILNSLGQPPEPVEHLYEKGRAVRPGLDLADAKAQLVPRAAGGHWRADAAGGEVGGLVRNGRELRENGHH